jgi:hypothetical protein
MSFVCREKDDLGTGLYGAKNSATHRTRVICRTTHSVQGFHWEMKAYVGEYLVKGGRTGQS